MTTGTTYNVTRYTIDIPQPLSNLQKRYEELVPPAPYDEIEDLVDRGAPWGDMLALVESTTPSGFLVYWKTEAHKVMRLAGDTASGIAYLMGNHTIAERMYRYQPSIMLYAPLHTMLWTDPEGGDHFSIDRPSHLFGSFGDPRVTEVGLELDRKVGHLLELLGLEVPTDLVAT